MEAFTNFTCSFMEILNKKQKHQWFIRISKDGMSINNPYAPIQLTLNYDTYPEFSMIDATYHGGGVEVEGRFKSEMFLMTVYYKDYYEDDSDVITHQDGCIHIKTDSMNFNFPVPYNLAKGLIQLGQGDTNLEGAVYVRND